MKKEDIDPETLKKIREYVYKNYKSYKDKNLIIKEYKSCYTVLKHPTGSPLILGKGIVK